MRIVITGFLSIFLAVLIFSSCEKGALTEAPISAPELSGADNEELVGSSYKDSDGSLVTEWTKPVRWDGKSPIEQDVVYSFKNVEELRQALAITSPWHLECYDKTRQKRAEKLKKQKSSASPELSYLHHYSWSLTYVHPAYPYDLTGEGICMSDDTWSGTLRYYMRVEWNKNDRLYYTEKENTYTDGESHTSSLFKHVPCPITTMFVDADIYLDEEKMYDSHAEGSCD